MPVETEGSAYLRMAHACRQQGINPQDVLRGNSEIVPSSVQIDWEIDAVYRQVRPALDILDDWRNASRRMDFTLD